MWAISLRRSVVQTFQPCNLLTSFFATHPQNAPLTPMGRGRPRRTIPLRGYWRQRHSFRVPTRGGE